MYIFQSISIVKLVCKILKTIRSCRLFCCKHVFGKEKWVIYGVYIGQDYKKLFIKIPLYKAGQGVYRVTYNLE